MDTTETLQGATTINDESRSFYKLRFFELILALNTNSAKERYEVMRELLNSYHFNLLNDNQIKYLIEQFQTKATTATQIGKECAKKGVIPRQKKKLYSKPTFFTNNKWNFECNGCEREVGIGEANIVMNEDRWCVSCGMEKFPEVMISKKFIAWKLAFETADNNKEIEV